MPRARERVLGDRAGARARLARDPRLVEQLGGRIDARRANRWPGRTTQTSSSTCSSCDSRPASSSSPSTKPSSTRPSRTAASTPGELTTSTEMRTAPPARAEARRSSPAAGSPRPCGSRPRRASAPCPSRRPRGAPARARRAPRAPRGRARAPAVGRPHPRPAPLEQRAPDAPLERGDPLRDGRLRERERAGRRVQRARVDRGDERRELAAGERIGRERHAHMIPLRNRTRRSRREDRVARPRFELGTPRFSVECSTGLSYPADLAPRVPQDGDCITPKANTTVTPAETLSVPCSVGGACVAPLASAAFAIANIGVTATGRCSRSPRARRSRCRPSPARRRRPSGGHR